MNKKRIISLLMTLVMMLGICTMPAYAEQNDSVISTSTEYFEDGSYFVVTLTELPNQARSNVRTGSKTVTYKNSNGKALWEYVVTADFTYNGTVATCVAVKDSYTIYDDNWHIFTHSTEMKGNIGYGHVTMKKKVLGITISTVTKDPYVCCSATGTLS